MKLHLVLLLVAGNALLSCTGARNGFEDLLDREHPDYPPVRIEDPGGGGETGLPAEARQVRIDLAGVLALSGGGTIDVLRARERYAEAVALSEAADARFLPDLAAGVQFTRHKGQIQATEGDFLDVTRQQTAAGIRAQLALRLGEAIFDSRAADYAAGATGEDLEASIQEAMLLGAALYLDLLAAAEETGIARRALEHASRMLSTQQTRLEAGFALKVDVDRAAARQAANEAALALAEAAFHSASVELARHLRLDPAVRVLPAGDRLVPFPEPDLPDREEAIRRVLTDNPHLRRAARMAQAAGEMESRATTGPFIPSIFLSGILAERGENPSRFGGSDDFTAMIGWEFKGLGFGTGAEARAARARRRLARLDLADARDRILAALVRTQAEIPSQMAAIDASAKAVAAAASALTQVQSRLEQGHALPVDALEAEASLVAAEQGRLRAVTRFNKSILLLKTLLGERPIP